MPGFVLIEAVEVEDFGGWLWSRRPSGDVQVGGVFDGRDDGGADGGQVGRPAADAAIRPNPFTTSSGTAEHTETGEFPGRGVPQPAPPPRPYPPGQRRPKRSVNLVACQNPAQGFELRL